MLKRLCVQVHLLKHYIPLHFKDIKLEAQYMCQRDSDKLSLYDAKNDKEENAY